MRAREFILESDDDDHRGQLDKTGFWGRAAAGSILYSRSTGRFCLAHRSPSVLEPNTWGMWGGAMDSGESPEDAARRELVEETGYTGSAEFHPLWTFEHSSGFRYYNFLALVDREFSPKMDWETQGYKWFDLRDKDSWPSPLHPGVKTLLSRQDVVDRLSSLKPDRQGVSESLDQPYALQWSEGDFGDVDALAELPDGTHLSIMFERENPKYDHWHVQFDRDGDQEITGEGDQQRVFATVLSAIKTFVEQRQPQMVYFSAVKSLDFRGTRTRLYDRLVQRYATQLGYKITREEHIDSTEYYLIRQDKTKQQGVTEDKIKLHTDPNYFGAEVGDYKASGPIVNISTSKLVGFEPDDKMNQPKSKANVKKMVAGLKKGDQLPPILVRRYKDGYQVVDGHHRFWAYKSLGIKSIPAQIVPAKDIEEIGKKNVAEALSWSSLDEGLSVEDKIYIFEEFYSKGSLTESIEIDKKEYFVSLFDMSSPLTVGKKYIVVPLSLIGKRIISFDTPSIAEFVAQGDGALTFNTRLGERTYPSKTMRDLSIFNTFTFSSIGMYDKFRTALSLKFDISLPTINKPEHQNVTENFADGKNPGRKGLAKRMGVPTKASVSRLRQIAKSSSGEKQRMAHWMANMKAGKKK